MHRKECTTDKAYTILIRKISKWKRRWIFAPTQNRWMQACIFEFLFGVFSLSLFFCGFIFIFGSKMKKKNHKRIEKKHKMCALCAINCKQHILLRSSHMQSVFTLWQLADKFLFVLIVVAVESIAHTPFYIIIKQKYNKW